MGRSGAVDSTALWQREPWRSAGMDVIERRGRTTARIRRITDVGSIREVVFPYCFKTGTSDPELFY